MSTIPKAAIEAALNAKTDELPEGVQYVLLRGLHAMGWEQPTSGSWEVLEAAIIAALSHFGEPVAYTTQSSIDQARRANGGNRAMLFSKPFMAYTVPLFAAPPAPSVYIKPLEWTSPYEGSGVWETSCGTSRYRIEKESTHFWFAGFAYSSLDEAKRGVANYHEARILAAIEAAPPVDEVKEQMAEALKSFKGAYEAYVNVMRNTTTGGETLAERRFSTGERQEEAEESAHEALCGITFAQLSAVSDALAAYEAEKAGKEESK